jgi:hypothetical protein
LGLLPFGVGFVLLERSFVSGNNSRLAVAELGVQLVGFCDELLRAFPRSCVFSFSLRFPNSNYYISSCALSN